MSTSILISAKMVDVFYPMQHKPAMVCKTLLMKILNDFHAAQV